MKFKIFGVICLVFKSGREKNLENKKIKKSMSKIIYVVPRNLEADSLAEKIKSICDSLNPDNIIAKPTEIRKGEGIIFGLSNPNETILRENTNIIFGQIFGNKPEWNVPGWTRPDGNYAIFRSSSESIEIITDILGTKAIWYYQDEEFFIASSSQRAIIKFLGKFDFNPEVIPWMVSNGLLGPGQSWDKRLSLIPPDSSLRLDRDAWQLSMTSDKVNFKPNKKTDKENFALFKDTLNNVFKDLTFDYSQWKLTLSGGYDSRGVLFALPKKDTHNIKIDTITWGLKGAENRSGNDAYIAKKITQKLGIHHKYYSTNISTDESLHTVLDRYLKNGDGRIDHLGGYLDGFSIWKFLYESNIQGIIRGDEVFGSYDFVSEFHLKKFIGLSLPKDYVNLKNIEFFQNFDSVFPEKFERRKNETLALWRDRLYQTYYIPNTLSALENLKQSYLEQVNPLLSRRIVETIRQMPDHLRTEKGIFKKYVNSFDNHSFKYAKASAIEPMKDIFRQPALVEIVKEELNSSSALSIFESNLLSHVQSKIQISS